MQVASTLMKPNLPLSCASASSLWRAKHPPLRSIGAAGCLSLLSLGSAPKLGAAMPDTAAQAAESVYWHGTVYTGEAGVGRAQAVAIRDGRFLFVGSDEDARRYVGPATRVHDLMGHLLMPGLIDGHLHTLAGGTQLHQCNLNYESLTVESLTTRIQQCLDQTRDQEPNRWLVVSNWFQQSTRPAGVIVTAADLGALHTSRPVVINTTFGHTLLVNGRGLEVANITAGTADPPGGAILHDAAGAPNGLLEDDARDLIQSFLPRPTPADDVAAGELALAAFAKQGITSLVDADSSDETIAAFTEITRRGHLTARSYLIPQIPAAVAAHPDARIAQIAALAERFAHGPLQVTPDVRIQSAKIYLDGVIAGPSFTGAMLAPYLVKAGSDAAPRWVAGPSRGPATYFSPEQLKHVVIELARHGLDPHMHVDGDRAVRTGLDAVQALRGAEPHRDVRPALAHDEIVDPADFARFKALNVIPVLSMQWEKPATDTIDNLRDYLGPQRFRVLEPAGFLAQAGARVTFGSDWPVDPLDEWFGLQVGITRKASPAAGARYAGRLGADTGLTRVEAVRAFTANGAYEVHAEGQIGTIKPGKLADFIVIDRNPFEISDSEIAAIQVLETTVGGRLVYSRSSAQ